MRTTTITVAVVAALAAMSGCDADPTTEEAPEVVETTEDAGDTEEPDAEGETEEPDESAEAALGTRDNPLSLGTVAVVGDYEVTVTEIDLDADQRFLDANEFNEPAEVGQYVLVTLEGTFNGGEIPEGNPGTDLSAVLVGSDAKQYAGFDSFATSPDPLYESPTLEAGGTFLGTIVLDVPTDAIDGAFLFVEPLISFDNDQRAYWALP